ncbi:MAG: hypothetical protein QOF66_7871 [Mycobacterium sp.]|uniref:hypothetical protein n=1 Tax=Mycobacterium sp. TaxID=1785 RepID=UPI0028BBCDD8|nr:hypothetical protein [Mycobacterium sp.]
MVVLTVAGTMALAVAVVALIARYVPGMTLPVVATAALAPYLMLAAPLAMIPLAVSGSWIAVAVAGAVTVATVAVQLPWYTRGRPSHCHRRSRGIGQPALRAGRPTSHRPNS